MNNQQNNTRNIRRYTVAEAAEILGVSQAAIRSRIHRETLNTERVEGTVYVLLSDEQIAHQSDEKSLDVINLLREQSTDLREQLSVLREQLAAEREANRENRRIIAGLVQRVPELEPAKEASSEERERSESDRMTMEREDAPPGADTPREKATERPWWRRWFS